jgi:arylsulfatase A
LFVSDEFRGVSDRGLYGDVIEEIDWSVGRILDFLKKEGLVKNTLVVFTSDNGPWASYHEQGGSSGPFYGAKGTSYEGGVREPAIFWWPGKIHPTVIMDIGSTLDLLPTMASIAGASLPDDRVYDGYDLSQVLYQGEEGPRDEMIYYHGSHIFAARKGNYKLHYYSNNPLGYPAKLEKLEVQKLYHLQHDPSEKFDLAEKHPEIIKEIEAMVQKHQSTVVQVKSNLEKRIEEK